MVFGHYYGTTSQAGTNRTVLTQTHLSTLGLLNIKQGRTRRAVHVSDAKYCDIIWTL